MNLTSHEVLYPAVSRKADSFVGLYFVAGGTSGIGRECVLELLRRNHAVVAIGLNQRHADELAELAPPAAVKALRIVSGDLTDPAIAESAANEQQPQPVTGLINAVGVVSAGGIETETPRGGATRYRPIWTRLST